MYYMLIFIRDQIVGIDKLAEEVFFDLKSDPKFLNIKLEIF